MIPMLYRVQKEEFRDERPADPAEARVQALKTALERVAFKLRTARTVRLKEDVHDLLWATCTAIEDGDLGPESVNVGTQFEAFFARMRELIAAHPDPVDPTTLGLPNDARFLDDMADFIGRRFGLDE